MPDDPVADSHQPLARCGHRPPHRLGRQRRGAHEVAGQDGSAIWRDSGFTAILVTHDVGEAVALADRILLLDRGTVALDIAVTAPRPRRRGDPALAAIEGRILDRLFGRG